MGLSRLTWMMIICGAAGFSQTGAPPEPDVLIFTDGEKLIGHLKRSNGATVTFKSDMAGEVTVEWSKIKELHSSQRFAVIRKGMKVRKHLDPSTIPQGTLSVVDQKLEVKPAEGRPPQIIPVSDAANVIDAAGFQKDIGHPGFFEDWKGAITAGVSLVEPQPKNNNF